MYFNNEIYTDLCKYNFSCNQEDRCNRIWKRGSPTEPLALRPKWKLIHIFSNKCNKFVPHLEDLYLEETLLSVKYFDIFI